MTEYVLCEIVNAFSMPADRPKAHAAVDEIPDFCSWDLVVFRRRVPTDRNPTSASCNNQRMIHRQRGDGRASDGSQPDNLRTVGTPRKMVRP